MRRIRSKPTPSPIIGCYTLFVQGCPHGCPGCHNPQTHDFEGGQDIELDTLLKDMCRNPFIKGVTFSGGEPFCKAEPLYHLAVELKRKGKHLMAYSGYTLGKIPSLRKRNSHDLKPI